MTENVTYNQLKTWKYLSLEWREINSMQICFEKVVSHLKRIMLLIMIENTVIGDKKNKYIS